MAKIDIFYTNKFEAFLSHVPYITVADFPSKNFTRCVCNRLNCGLISEKGQSKVDKIRLLVWV